LPNLEKKKRRRRKKGGEFRGKWKKRNPFEKYGEFEFEEETISESGTLPKGVLTFSSRMNFSPGENGKGGGGGGSHLGASDEKQIKEQDQQ